jgi:hypothetical protein
MDYDLFNTAPYQPHSETSREAAEAIEPHMTPLQQKVLDALDHLGGKATDEQLIAYLDLSPSTVRPRRVELVQLGVLRDSGKKVRTLSRRRAVLWERNN